MRRSLLVLCVPAVAWLAASVGQDPTAECLPTLQQLIADSGAPDFNLRTASFSTNYLRTGLVWQQTVLGEAAGIADWRVRGDFEIHFGTDAKIKPFHGRFRAEFSYTFVIRGSDPSSGRWVNSLGFRVTDVPSPELVGERYQAGNRLS